MVLHNGMIFRHDTHELGPGMLADLHCHNGIELIYVRSGKLAHVVEGRMYILTPGDLAVVHPSKYHYLEQLSSDPYERYIIQFDPQLHSIDTSFLPKEMEVVRLKDGSVAAELFSKMDYYCDRLDGKLFTTLLERMLEELFVNLQLISGERRQEEGVLSPVLRRALSYINEHLFTITDVEEVAAALYVSSSYLFRLFRTSLHQSPKKYIRDKRLLAAQRKIRRGMNPTAACQACGFKEYATFFRSYKAFFGYPPSQETTSL